MATTGFDVLAEVVDLLNRGQADAARDLAVRAKDHADVLGSATQVLNALLREVGLLPYLPSSGLGTADALAVELHRPRGLENVVLHRAQGIAYRHLAAGRDLVLMAPTSFGKSLLIDALIAAGHLGRVLIIVPSIALIDETRARLQRRFGHARKIVTHASQALTHDCVLVMTQERALDLTREAVPSLDLLVVDEFYKLDPRMDPGRSALLNAAFDRLRRRARQVFLLGPNVGGLAPGLPNDFRPRIIATDVRTTALDVVRVNVPAAERLGELDRILDRNPGPTLIYCQSPASCRRVADHLSSTAAAAGEDGEPGLQAAAAWTREHIHAEWGLARFLELGIGIHHARMPRWLGQRVVRAFDEGDLNILICTSTLIEGVNTAARNVVLFDNKLGDRSLDLFSFNNIAGRSGRMWRHFVGRVFHFHPMPRGPLPDIDVPVLSQSPEATDGLLLEIPAPDRSDGATARLRPLLDQRWLSEETLRANVGIPLERQLALARVLDEDPEFYEDDLAWSGMPTRGQLGAASRLIVDHLMAITGKRNGISTARQLAGWLDRVRADSDLSGLIEDESSRDFSKDVDEAVEAVIQFQRTWVQFEFPRQLRALERIAREVLSRSGCSVGDFGVFAAACERFFLPPNIQVLDEYGIPPQLAIRLFPTGIPTLDEMLHAIRQLNVDAVEVSQFERELLVAAQSRL